MTQQNENTPIVDDNNAKNDDTKVESNVKEGNMVPQSRVNELTAKFHKVNNELEELRKSQEEERAKQLEKQGEYQTMYEEQVQKNKAQAKETDGYKADSDAWNTYKTNKRASLMETITNDEDRSIAEDLSLAKLEKFANRVTQTNTVGTPNQRPANSTKGTGEYGGYSSYQEWALRDPKGYEQANGIVGLNTGESGKLV